jgi:hypothetical protein
MRKHWRCRSGTSDPLIEAAPILNNIAYIHFDRGEYASAEQLVQQSIKLYVEAFGPGHVFVGGALGNLASVSFEQKQFRLSERLSKKLRPF